MAVSSRERVLAAVRGELLDRPPFALWRHFYEVETKGARPLAEAMIGWARSFGFDLLKYNPRADYHVEPFGAELPVRPASLDHPTFHEMLEGLRLARAALGDLPIVMTVFTPLAICARIVGPQRLSEALRDDADRLDRALEAVADTFARFAPACLDAGADGIFYATLPIASRNATSDEQWARFGRPYDVRVLDAVAGAPLNVLHVCGDRTRVLELADYPHVAALSWNAHAAGNPTLREVRATGKAAVGGISDGALLRADAAAVEGEVARGLAETGGRGWIAAGGCTVPPTSTGEAIRAARSALERFGG